MSVTKPGMPQRPGISTAGESIDDGPIPGELEKALAANRPIERFDKTERVVHWSTAIIMLELLATGAILYVPSLTLAVGHRGIIENIHVYTGIALLVPLAVGIAGPWRAKLVADLRRFDRWTTADWDYFRRARRKTGDPLGKFNGGQKAEASLVGAGMIVMLVTGVLMRFAPPSWINWQQGATLVHDVGFLAVGITVFVHIVMAVNRPDQLKSMYSGVISRKWARQNAPAWLDEADADSTHAVAAVPRHRANRQSTRT